MSTLRRGLALLVLVALLATTAWADEPGATSSRWRDLYCEPPTLRCRSGCLEWGFDSMLYVADARERARLGLGGYVQWRADRTERKTGATTDLGVERFRLIFEGRVTQDWLAHVRVGINDGTDFDVALAFVTWKPTSRLSLIVGQQFFAVSREDWMFAEDLLTTEYSANDQVFGTGRSQGFQAIYEGSRDRIYAGLSTADIGPQTAFLGSLANATWALTGRYERQFLTTDWSTWDDVIGRVGRPRGVLVGAGLAFAHSAENEDRRNDFLATADASYSWRRGQALAYGAARYTGPSDAAGFTQYGLLVQASQFVTPTALAYGRYELVAPGSQPGRLETYQSLTVGCSYLPFRWTNRSRLSLELSYLFTGISQTIVPASRTLGFLPSSDPQLYLRLQLQFGF